MRQLTATIREGIHGYLTADTDAKLDYLKVIHLTRSEAGHAKVGDKVKIEYQATSSRGHWVVVEVLR